MALNVNITEPLKLLKFHFLWMLKIKDVEYKVLNMLEPDFLIKEGKSNLHVEVEDSNEPD